MPGPFDIRSFMERGRKRHIHESILEENKSLAERQTAALERIATRAHHLDELRNLANIAWGVRHRESPPEKSSPIPLLLFGILVALIVIAWKVAI